MAEGSHGLPAQTQHLMHKCYRITQCLKKMGKISHGHINTGCSAIDLKSKSKIQLACSHKDVCKGHPFYRYIALLDLEDVFVFDQCRLVKLSS